MAPQYLVTRPLMPPLESVLPALAEMWDDQWLTNGGAFHAELERRLAEWLGVRHVALFANGTLALAGALRVALGAPEPGDEVITTPYTFVATAQAIELAGYTPRFVDIEPDSPNLDPAAVAAATGPRTRGVMPVHCYGIPADTRAFDRYTRRTGIPVVYDAAHAFGARHDGAALAAHGRLSALSFHATKIFHTAEGGGVVAHTPEDHAALARLRNFGITGQGITVDWGVNAKMSELSAALGLQVLPLVADEIARRGEIARRCATGLADLPGLRVLGPIEDAGHNHAYLPVLVDDASTLSRDELHDALAERGVHARRYFHPLLTDMPYFVERGHRGAFPHAQRLSSRILCLPLHGRLTDADLQTILERIHDAYTASAPVRTVVEPASAAL
ncbi:DegT/DnrJ/EryC1/StrS family aminotransferase [Microbacterium sp.]|uniref:DegT/DnrJ/EryC1/StrS family aminotransferase n=1 Tax=Microbacterium sp. TaxID=51671 RepID=UPI0037C8535D